MLIHPRQFIRVLCASILTNGDGTCKPSLLLDSPVGTANCTRFMVSERVQVAFWLSYKHLDKKEYTVRVEKKNFGQEI